MKKTLLIASTGMLALFSLQIFWLYNLYHVNKQRQIHAINELFDVVIKKELIQRTFDLYPEKKEISFKISPIDSISLNEIRVIGIDHCYSEIFTQIQQEQIINNNPIKLQKLDSLFTAEANRQNIGITVTQILYYDQFYNQIDKSRNHLSANSSTISTDMKSIGTKRSRFVKAFVILPPEQILEEMRYSLIVSLCIVCIILFVLYYQWAVIVKESKRLEEQKQSIYAIIHDLKSPLNSLYTLLDIVELDQIKSEQISILEKGKERIKLVALLFEQILDIVRKNKIPLKQTEIHVPEFIEKIWQDIRNCYPDKTVQFEKINLLTKETISTDPIHLERCLRNLFDNALKYSDQNVTVTVTLSDKQNKLQIKIKDTGWGIPKCMLNKLGNLFYRVKFSNKPAREGYGIGISCVKGLLREMGGTLQIKSIEGVGSVFIIQL